MSNPGRYHGRDGLFLQVDWMIWYLGVTFLGSIVSLLIFLLFLLRGQFDDIEEPKYQMLRDDL